MLGLRTTIYKVSNLQKAKEWYSKVFKENPYFDELYYVGFNIKGYELGLMLEENSNLKSDNVLSYWGVENIEKTYRFFLENGATAHEKPMNVGGELMVASVKDPWENVIGLIYNPDFKLPV
ncbi:MAG: putative enzyme related to lactoylglutathione lyase [Polaribacter sp.]|jgi:predicted enzyme related to lactoylglutathione lyase